MSHAVSRLAVASTLAVLCLLPTRLLAQGEPAPVAPTAEAPAPAGAPLAVEPVADPPAEVPPAAVEELPPAGDPAPVEDAGSAPAEASPATPEPAPAAAPGPAAERGWGWLSVAGWAALAVGAIGVIVGAVTLANPQDFYAIAATQRITPNSVFGFGALVTGFALAVVGGVLLYLDTALN